MSSITFEDVYALSYVRDSVNSIMDSLVRQYPMLEAHDDDIRQQLWIILNRQLPQFDSSKCSIASYARMTLDSAIKEIRRSYLSPRNLAKSAVIQMAVPIDNEYGESPFLIDEAAEREKLCATVREAVALLSPIEQEICRLLADGHGMNTIRIKLQMGYDTLMYTHIPHIKQVLGENIF